VREKIYILFFPAVVLLAIVAVAYSFVHWMLLVVLGDLPLKEMWIEFLIPGGLVGILVLIFIRPRLRILNLQGPKKDLTDFYCVVFWILFSIPAIVAQTYITSATGSKTSLENIREIDQHFSKYYSVRNFYLDKNHIGGHSAFNASGKYNEHFDMTLYIAVPMLASMADTIQGSCPAWLCLSYHKQISNRLSSEEKEARFKTFVAESQVTFKTTDLTTFDFLVRPGNSDARDGYIEAVKTSKEYASNRQLLLAGNGKFEDRAGGKFRWIFLSSLIALGIWGVMIAIPKRSSSNFPATAQEKNSSGWKDFVTTMTPREGFGATPVLIEINILVFMIMVIAGLGFISFSASDLLHWGANFRPATTKGQAWRLVTNMFLHGGVMHLLFNMYGLMFVGIFLEPVLGLLKYVVIYLVTGLVASLASIWWYPATVSVGASGAIFGLYGVFFAALLLKVYPTEFSKAFLWSTIAFIGYNLLFGLVGGIDNAAHIGGLVTGFVIGLFLSNSMREQIAENIEKSGQVDREAAG
jgi:rhomboid protease GluP